ncbi:MAG: hypothetical protein ABFC54_11900 [Thermoguttaceae bacterium]
MPDVLKQRRWLAIAAVVVGVFLAYVQGRKTVAVRSLPRPPIETSTVESPPAESPSEPSLAEEPSPPVATPWQPPPATASPPAEPPKNSPTISAAPAAEPSPPIAPTTTPRPATVSEASQNRADGDRLWSDTFDLTKNDSDKPSLVFDVSDEKSKGIASVLDFNGKSSVGWKKPLLESENTVFRGRFAGALSSEYNAVAATPEDMGQVPEVVFGLQFERRLDSRNKILGEMEFGRDVMEFGRSRVRTKAAWEILLNEGKNLSFQTGLQERSTRNSTTEPTKELDYTFDLIWKF